MIRRPFTRRPLLRTLLALVCLLTLTTTVRATDGEVGIASHYGPGNGVAMPFCSWTLRHAQGCGTVRIQSHETGIVVLAPVVDYCLCKVPGSAHPVRIVDLQWGVLAALGLERGAGLYQVTVWTDAVPAAPLPPLPDTAMPSGGTP